MLSPNNPINVYGGLAAIAAMLDLTLGSFDAAIRKLLKSQAPSFLILGSGWMAALARVGEFRRVRSASIDEDPIDRASPSTVDAAPKVAYSLPQGCGPICNHDPELI